MTRIDPRPTTKTTAQSRPSSVVHRTATVAGVDVFYREAGSIGSPKLLLLHGYPASSHQYRNLMPALADRFHLLAPDYPGFGNTGVPDPSSFAYTFEHLTEIVDQLLHEVDFTGSMGIYMEGYGGAIGNRLVDRHRDWLQWQIIQNANAYEEGLSPAWDPFKALWSNRSPETEQAMMSFLEPDGVKLVYTHGHKNPETLSPDNWNMDSFFLARQNAKQAQMDLFYDFRSNVALFPKWQESARRYQPKTLILWGCNDIFFVPSAGEMYLRDLPDAELLSLDSGHFIVEDSIDDVVAVIDRFFDERVA
ncbi:alpha/beta fold hydrolase [Plantactinospora soyae]|uniref:Pimeloyl-ACP methyl ester carboxylesterase n=1 Tax=Plantactinospora soyae TaxID=1544732 RepID=A0A927R0V7_9ACTN|nr:alpha/beta hydrolase [Plantactinospora soyae]MBE1490652.1 pimeloyl-ACP methyl ester carboxylesterase [Plantactinospora soyae]